MVDGVLNRFETDIHTVDAVRMIGAVTARKNVEVFGLTVGIDQDAVVTWQSGGLCQFDVGNHPDADDHDIGGRHPAIGSRDTCAPPLALERGDLNAGRSIDTLARVQPFVEDRGDHPVHGPIGHLQHRHDGVDPGCRRDDLKADASSTTDHETCAGTHVCPDRVRIRHASQVVNAAEI